MTKPLATTRWRFIPMIQSILNSFRTPTATDIAKKELAEYQRLLLKAQADASYHAKMVEFYSEGIGRLTKMAK